MDLNQLSKEIHETAKSKGFWDGERNTGEIFMLIVSELGEALEAHRKGRFANLEQFERVQEWNSPVDFADKFPKVFEGYIKDTFEDELADVAIRILDFAAFMKINFTKHGIPIQNVQHIENVGEQLMAVNCQLVQAYFEHLELQSGGKFDHQYYFLKNALGILFWICDKNKIDLERHISLKMQYNKTRARLHGKNY